MKEKAIYITRCNIGWYSKNANAYRKPLEVAKKYDTTLYVSVSCCVPKEIEEKCVGVVRFRHVTEALKKVGDRDMGETKIFTGFDFPCMYVGWRLKRKFGCSWTVFLWDPPSLSHRDGFPPLRWAIDSLFIFFADRCDKLVLNIHPGLLDEIGFKPRDGQLELRMQDAWESLDLGKEECNGDGCFDYDFGVLANWSVGKGGPFMTKALELVPGSRCLWIGDPPQERVGGQIEFVGRLPQGDAFVRLCRCKILVVPYLATRAFKWNFPLKLFEYLQIGRPILASDNPGNASVSERYVGRIELFKSGDIGDFAKKAKLLLGRVK